MNLRFELVFGEIQFTFRACIDVMQSTFDIGFNAKRVYVGA